MEELGNLVTIFDSEHHPLKAPRPVQIALSCLDANVWLGHGPSRHHHWRARRCQGSIDPIDDVPAKTGVLGYQRDRFGRWMSRTTAGAATE